MPIKNQPLDITYWAWNVSTNQPITGDAANHTIKLVQDGTEAAATNAPAEISAANEAGKYKLHLTAGDMNFNVISPGGKSSTANVVLIFCCGDIITDRGILPASFPTNFASLSISGAGKVAATIASGDGVDAATLVARLTAARAGYLDNLNVGGNVASHADVVAINLNATKHMTLATVQQYAPSETYTIEMRTYAAADGSAVNADTTPTLTATGTVSGSLSGNLSAATNPATGVYRWTYMPGATPTLEQIRMDGSATISSATFTLSAMTQTVDQPTAVFTATDKSNLTAVFNKLPANNIADETLLLAAIGTPMQAGTAVALAASQPNYAPSKAGDAMTLTSAYDAAKTAASATAVAAIAAVFSGMTSLANWLRAAIRKSTPDATALSEINTGGGTFDVTKHSQEAIGNQAIINGGLAGPGATACVIEIKSSGIPVPQAEVWLTSDQAGTTTVAGTLLTDSNGNVTFMLTVGNTYYVWMRKDGFQPFLGVPYVASAG